MLLSISDIEVGDRQRTVFDKKAHLALKDSIIQLGLLQPIVVWKDPTTEKFILVAGERRLRALSAIHTDTTLAFHGGVLIPAGHIPVTLASTADLFAAEFAENEIREPLNHLDRARALARIHEVRVAADPGQKIIDTAREIVEKGGIDAPKSLTTTRREIRMATFVARHIDDPSVQSSKNLNDAYKSILAKQEAEAAADLQRMRLANMKDAPSISVKQGDCISILQDMDDGMVDLILCDPPYGLGVDSNVYKKTTSLHHNYDDSRANAQAVMSAVLTDGFRVAKGRANLFMFCDISMWDWLTQNAKRCGWSVFSTPIVWHKKNDTEGYAPWGRLGFRRTYELIMFATKGERGLISLLGDTISIAKPSRSERIHAAGKPVELYELLIEASTLAGDFVLDPCCGSGASLVAMQNRKRVGLGIDLSEESVNLTLANLSGEIRNDTD